MNTFKKGDVVKWEGQTRIVSRKDGPYVYFESGLRAIDYTECTLVPHPKFKAGDVVRNSYHEHTIKCVKTEGCWSGAKYDGPLAYDYADIDSWDEETSLTLVRRADAFAVATATPKFKAGDIVRCLKNCEREFTKGKTYEVRSVGPLSDRISIVRDDRGSTTNGWVSEYFELVMRNAYADSRNPARWSVNIDSDGWMTGVSYTPKTSPTIVVRKDRNGYAPNQNPRVHDTVELAKKEAERLALANPGVEFATFTLAGTSKATVSTVSV